MPTMPRYRWWGRIGCVAAAAAGTAACGGKLAEKAPASGAPPDASPASGGAAALDDAGNTDLEVDAGYDGAVPSLRDGAAPNRSVRCGKIYVHGDRETCLTSLGECADGRVYGASCIQGSCVCLIDSKQAESPAGELACPESIAQMNELCGWSLTSR